MKRNEYRLLVENWNNFLIEEEARLKKNALLSESIILNENKLKKIAKSLSVTLPTLILALSMSAFANSGNAQDIPSEAQGANRAQAEKLVSDGTAEEIAEKLGVSQQEKLGFDLIGKKIQEIQDENDGEDAVTYVKTVYSKLTTQYATHLKINPKNIKDIISKSRFLKNAFGSILSGDFDGSQFSQKIKKLRGKKDISKLKRLATVVQVFVTCSSALDKCHSELENLAKASLASTERTTLQGTVGFDDGGDLQTFLKSNFSKKIWDSKKSQFESQVDDLMGRIFDDSTSDEEFSDIEKAIIGGLLTDDGGVDMRRIESWANNIDWERGEKLTQIKSNLTMNKFSSVKTKDGKQNGIKNIGSLKGF